MGYITSVLPTSKSRVVTRDVGYVSRFQYESAVTVKFGYKHREHAELKSVLEQGDNSRALRTAFAVLMWQDLTRALQMYVTY